MNSAKSSTRSPGGTGLIRIIGGQWRGRKLPILDKPGLRPTSDRIRETLFNWLAPILEGSLCLDCFAGSGALALEALSRHASHVVLLEKDPFVVKQLKLNIQRLNTQQAEVIHTDTLRWLSQSGTASNAFNVVFLDPPFHQQLLNQNIQLLEHQGWLAEEAWIYVESEIEHGMLSIPENWMLHRDKVAGQVRYRLYHRLSTAKNSEETQPC